MTIDLFRPYWSPNALAELAKTVAPDANGRVFIGEGKKAAAFEEEFSKVVGMDVLLTSSCTFALDLALHIAGLIPGTYGGDVPEVISTPVTCSATNGVIVNRGARIVWADVDPRTGLIDPADVARKITRRTKAVMAVDWAGRSCDYRGLRRAVKQTPWLNIPIIEDAAHHLFVQPYNRGDYVAWSFQAIKFSTTGDGGALVTPPEQAERARLLRWYGLDRRSAANFRCSQDIQEAGYKYHMNDIDATIGLANMSVAISNQAIQFYNACRLENLIHDSEVVTKPPSDPLCSWWLYTLLVDDQQAFIDHLATFDVEASMVHRRNDEHPAFHFPSGPLPGVDAFANHQVSVPVGWWLTDDDLQTVANAVNDYSATHSGKKLEATTA